MARFLQWSDLHRELSDADFPRPSGDCPAGSVDAILVAGDLNSRGRHIEDAKRIQDAWGVPVVMIRGNHERYGSVWQDFAADEAARLAAAAAEGYDIRLLDCGETIIGDTRILGCTLWTDFDIIGEAELMMQGAEVVMNDYHKIGWLTPEGEARKLRARDTLHRHQEEKAWLLEALQLPFEGRTLVMTHHLPAPELLAPEARKGDYAPGYISDLREAFLAHRIDAWVTGHTHWARRGLIEGLQGPIAFTANMMGYEGQYPNFEPYRVLDTANPALGLEPLEIAERTLRHLEPACKILERLREECSLGL